MHISNRDTAELIKTLEECGQPLTKEINVKKIDWPEDFELLAKPQEQWIR